METVKYDGAQTIACWHTNDLPESKTETSITRSKLSLLELTQLLPYLTKTNP